MKVEYPDINDQFDQFIVRYLNVRLHAAHAHAHAHTTAHAHMTAHTHELTHETFGSIHRAP
jgi:hypothetical protein